MAAMSQQQSVEAGTAHHDNHGSTPAAWTAVAIIMIAFVVGTIGIMVGSWVTFGVGVALVVVGAIVGKVMQMMGMGKKIA
jgi:energy-coupling factor transporter transmembrane protein EcfT